MWVPAGLAYVAAALAIAASWMGSEPNKRVRLLHSTNEGV
jgi:hypothetical protein